MYVRTTDAHCVQTISTVEIQTISTDEILMGKKCKLIFGDIFHQVKHCEKLSSQSNF